MNISYKKIELFFHNVLTKIKIKKNDRELLIRSLVGSSLRGVDSHGIRLFSHYVHCLEQGRIKKNPKMKVIKKQKELQEEKKQFLQKMYLINLNVILKG